MEAKKVCRKCWGHAVSLEDVVRLTRVPKPPHVVHPRTGTAHKPKFSQLRTECGLDTSGWSDPDGV